jgi:SAM-dependent methyltransferase
MGKDQTQPEERSLKSTDTTTSFVSDLEDRLKSTSDALEEMHMEAAIDIATKESDDGDLTNLNSVANCLSPYVPTAASRIEAFVSWIELRGSSSTEEQGDILLDIGCGDGRICIATTKMSGKPNTLLRAFENVNTNSFKCYLSILLIYHSSGCQSFGLDVSALCVNMAREVAKEEGLSEEKCCFYQVDATEDPDLLLSGMSNLSCISFPAEAPIQM